MSAFGLSARILLPLCNKCSPFFSHLHSPHFLHDTTVGVSLCQMRSIVSLARQDKLPRVDPEPVFLHVSKVGASLISEINPTLSLQQPGSRRNYRQAAQTISQQSFTDIICAPSSPPSHVQPVTAVGILLAVFCQPEPGPGLGVGLPTFSHETESNEKSTPMWTTRIQVHTNIQQFPISPAKHPLQSPWKVLRQLCTMLGCAVTNMQSVSLSITRRTSS